MPTKLTSNVTIGTTPAGCVWTAYAGRHTTDDVVTMTANLRKLHTPTYTPRIGQRVTFADHDVCLPGRIVKVNRKTVIIELLSERRGSKIKRCEIDPRNVNGRRCFLTYR